MRKRNPISNSVMVGGFAKVGDYMTCFGTFREIFWCGVWLDNYTIHSVIRTCRDIMDLQMGRLIHVIALNIIWSWIILFVLHLWTCMQNVGQFSTMYHLV